MGGNNRQKKSSSGFFCFSLFKSKKHRGYYDEDAYGDGMKFQKVWPSDEDRGRWGVADPGIDMKVEAFLAHNKKRISQSE